MGLERPSNQRLNRCDLLDMPAAAAAPGSSMGLFVEYDSVIAKREMGPVNVVAVYLRSVFEELLLRRVPAGSRLLDLGCGMPETPLSLARQGFTVQVLGAGAKRAEDLRAEAARRGLSPDRLVIDGEGRIDLAHLKTPVDVVYAFPDTLAGETPDGFGRDLASVLSERGLAMLTFDNQAARRSPGALTHGLGWRRLCALGVLIPGPERSAWATRNPQSFGLLAAVERIVRSWPVIRARGRYAVWLGASSLTR
jgi:hypothetical protein